MAVDPLLQTFGSRQSSPTLTVAVEVMSYITPPPGATETPANARVIGRRWDTGEIVELALADNVKGAHNRPSIRQFYNDNSANPVTTAIGGTLVLESAKPTTELPPLGHDKSAAVMVGRWIVRIANSKNEGWALRSMARLNPQRLKNPDNPAEGYTQRLQIMDNKQAVTVGSMDELQEQIFHALDNEYRERHDAFTRPGFPLAFVRVSTDNSSVVRSLMGGSYIPPGNMQKVPKTPAMMRADLPSDPGYIEMIAKARNLVGKPGYTVEVIPGSQMYVGRRTMDKGAQRIYGPTDEHQNPLFTELVVGIRRSPKTGVPQVLFSGTADKSLLPNTTGRPLEHYEAPARMAGASVTQHNPTTNDGSLASEASAAEREQTSSASLSEQVERANQDTGKLLHTYEVAFKAVDIICLTESHEEEENPEEPVEITTSGKVSRSILNWGNDIDVYQADQIQPGAWSVPRFEVHAVLNFLKEKGYRVDEGAFEYYQKLAQAYKSSITLSEPQRHISIIEEDEDSFTVRANSAGMIHDLKLAGDRHNIQWKRVSTGAWKIARDDIPSLLIALKTFQIVPEFTSREAVDKARASSVPTKTVDIAIVSEADDSFTAEGQTDSGRQMLDETHIAWKGARAETEGHWAISRAHLQTLLGCIKAYDHIHYEMTRREDMDQVAEPAQVLEQKPEAPIESPAAEQKQAAAGASQPSPRVQPHADAQMAQNELSPLLKDAYEAATRADQDFQALLVKQYGANAGDARYQYTHADPALNAAATEKKYRDQVLHWATMATRCAQKIPAGTAAPGEPMRMKVNAPGPDRPQEVLTLVATTPYQAGYLRHAAPQWGLAFDERTGELPLSTTQAETALQDMINEGIAVKAEYVAPPVQQALNPATAQSQTPSDQVAAPVEDAQHGDDLGQLDLADLDMNFDDALSHAYQQYSQNL